MRKLSSESGEGEDSTRLSTLETWILTVDEALDATVAFSEGPAGSAGDGGSAESSTPDEDAGVGFGMSSK